jgi:hypothetical protein
LVLQSFFVAHVKMKAEAVLRGLWSKSSGVKKNISAQTDTWSRQKVHQNNDYIIIFV